jgi:arabinofuranosyltransferase
MRHSYILPAWVGPALGAGLVLASGALCWDHTVDDAYIVARYAQRIVAGQGYTFSAGPPSDGVTGPLWLLPGLAASLLGIDPVLAAKLFGLACMALAVAHWLAWLGRCAGGRRVMPWAALTLGLSPTLAAWGVGGLETGLATLLFALAGVAALGRPTRPVRLGVCLGALAWLRPELAPAAGVLWLASGTTRSSDREAWRAPWRSLALAGAVALGVVVFRLALFGEPLPLSWAAKPGELGHGVDYALRGWAWLSGLLGLGALWALAARGGRRARALLGVCIAHSLALLGAGGDWMPGFRLLAPLIPVAVLAMALGGARLAERRQRAAAWLCLTGPLVAAVLGLALQVPALGAVERSRQGVGRELASLLAQKYERVALLDVGYLMYGSALQVIDLGGVTDPRVGRLPGGHGDKAIAARWLLAQRPDAIVLHSRAAPLWDAQGVLLRLDGFPVERRLAASAELRAAFRVTRAFRYAPDYHYVLLEPRVP